MKRVSLKLALLCGALLVSTLGARPAAAQTVTFDPLVVQSSNDTCAAVLYSKASHTVIEISDRGVTRQIYCHTANIADGIPVVINGVTYANVGFTGDATILGEAFNVCVGGKFHVGGASTATLNLLPASPTGKGNESLNRPFTQSSSGVTFLPQTGVAPDCLTTAGQPAPAYNLDSLPLGTMVSLITENLPVKGLPANAGGPNDDGTNADGSRPLITKCIGVRTTFQIMTGTCKLWKTRKFFNTCSSRQLLTQVKEFEEIIPAFMGGQAASATGGVLTAVALLDPPLNQLVSLTTGNT